MRRKKKTYWEQQQFKDLKFGSAKDSIGPKKPSTLVVEKFQKNSYSCKNFFWKQSDEKNIYGQVVGSAIAFCKLSNKPCNIKNCPLIKN